MAKRISRARRFPARKTNARGDVSFPDARNAAREKRNYFPERMPGVRTRARIFGGPGDGDSEGKKEGIGWEKEHQGKKGQRLGRSD